MGHRPDHHSHHGLHLSHDLPCPALRPRRAHLPPLRRRAATARRPSCRAAAVLSLGPGRLSRGPGHQADGGEQVGVAHDVLRPRPPELAALAVRRPHERAGHEHRGPCRRTRPGSAPTGRGRAARPRPSGATTRPARRPASRALPGRYRAPGRRAATSRPPRAGRRVTSAPATASQSSAGGSPSSSRVSAPYADWLCASAGGPTRAASTRRSPQYAVDEPGATRKPSATVATKATSGPPGGRPPPDEHQKHHEDQRGELHPGGDARPARPTSGVPGRTRSTQHRQHQEQVHLPEGQVLPDRLEAECPDGQQRDQPSRRPAAERAQRQGDHGRQRCRRGRGPQGGSHPERQPGQRHHHQRRERRVGERQPGHRVPGLRERRTASTSPAAVLVDVQVGEPVAQPFGQGSGHRRRDDQDEHRARPSSSRRTRLTRRPRRSRSEWRRSELQTNATPAVAG